MAILIEHELVEQLGQVLWLTAEEGKAVLSLRRALQRRRRLELGLE